MSHSLLSAAPQCRGHRGPHPTRCLIPLNQDCFQRLEVNLSRSKFLRNLSASEHFLFEKDHSNTISGSSHPEILWSGVWLGRGVGGGPCCHGYPPSIAGSEGSGAALRSGRGWIQTDVCRQLCGHGWVSCLCRCLQDTTLFCPPAQTPVLVTDCQDGNRRAQRVCSPRCSFSLSLRQALCPQVPGEDLSMRPPDSRGQEIPSSGEGAPLCPLPLQVLGPHQCSRSGRASRLFFNG